jgi:hypothetical protein
MEKDMEESDHDPLYGTIMERLRKIMKNFCQES